MLSPFRRHAFRSLDLSQQFLGHSLSSSAFRTPLPRPHNSTLAQPRPKSTSARASRSDCTFQAFLVHLDTASTSAPLPSTLSLDPRPSSLDTRPSTLLPPPPPPPPAHPPAALASPPLLFT